MWAVRYTFDVGRQVTVDVGLQVYIRCGPSGIQLMWAVTYTVDVGRHVYS